MIIPKHCPDCGRFMALTDLLPENDEFDEELAIDCGFDPDHDDIFDERWQRFNYVQDQWECTNCNTLEWYTEGRRYYFDPAKGDYSARAPKRPLTETELAALENARQEKAGQLRLPLEAIQS